MYSVYSAYSDPLRFSPFSPFRAGIHEYGECIRPVADLPRVDRGRRPHAPFGAPAPGLLPASGPGRRPSRPVGTKHASETRITRPSSAFHHELVSFMLLAPKRALRACFRVSSARRPGRPSSRARPAARSSARFRTDGVGLRFFQMPNAYIFGLKALLP